MLLDSTINLCIVCKARDSNKFLADFVSPIASGLCTEFETLFRLTGIVIVPSSNLQRYCNPVTNRATSHVVPAIGNQSLVTVSA